MGFCSCTSKYILFFFNLACALAGLVVLVVGVISYLNGRDVKSALDGEVTVISGFLMFVGGAIFLIAFFGCCGAIREDSCCLTTYGIILSILLLIQIAIGVTAFVYRGKVDESLRKFYQTEYESYQENNKQAIETIDAIQTALHCCGPEGPYFFANRLPPSCCPRPDDHSQICDHTTAYQDGCLIRTANLVKNALQLSGIVSISIAVIEVLGVVFAFCLASSIRRSELRGYA